MHKAHGGKTPPHVAKHGDGGEGPVERDHTGKDTAKHSGSSGSGQTKPRLVSGNQTVVAHAEEKKSIGEVPGIYAKKRLDRRVRPGGIQGS
jgi:hypothetical protein